MNVREAFAPASGAAHGGSDAVVGADMTIVGLIRNGGRIEVHGVIDGEIEARHLIVHPGGRVIGTVRVDTAEIHGALQGRVRVRNLVAIAGTGSVSGDVHYGRLSLAEGGDLAADVRNVPPELGGDFEMTVRRGHSARVTTADVTAHDPDDGAHALVYAVSQPAAGHVALRRAPETPILQFTQADLESGDVVFRHDGSDGRSAGFAVMVTDAQGATSGDPRQVSVAVLD